MGKLEQILSVEGNKSSDQRQSGSDVSEQIPFVEGKKSLNFNQMYQSRPAIGTRDQFLYLPHPSSKPVTVWPHPSSKPTIVWLHPSSKSVTVWLHPPSFLGQTMQPEGNERGKLKLLIFEIF